MMGNKPMDDTEYQGAMITVAGNVTEPVTAAATDTNEARFRLFFENSLDVIVIADDNGRFLDVNQAACSLFGYSREQMLHMHVADLLTPEAPGAAEQYQHYLQTGREAGEFTFVRADNQVRVASYSACRVAPGQHLSILRDITENRQHLAQIEALHHRLHQAIREAYHRQKNQMQILASMIDLRLMDEIEVIPVEELRRLGRQLRAISVINDILTLETRDDAAADALSSKSLLDKVLMLLQQSAGDKRLSFHIEDVTVSAKVAAALALTCNETVSNGWKHGGDMVEVIFRVHRNTAMLKVSDNGPGYPTDFDAVQTAHTGLEIIQAMVRTDLKGTTRFENRPEGGAKVVIVFPLPDIL
jgi:PAS domain S-box-containing protein